MKRYYICYYNDFANTYNLYWTDEEHKQEIPSSCERITRKEALRKAHAENSRRQYDQAFSGYADNVIYPIDYDVEVEMNGYYKGVALEPGADPAIMEYVNRGRYEAALANYKSDKAAGRIW